ncbi:T9SS type A sorting domain-containing protein [Aquimarina sp. 2304DJ70-9]|uniref:T9SS type A sorting domain-containing protein n=1 Tax=Aquimarina penaris TaxID=3231044 RepID=UPI0034621091
MKTQVLLPLFLLFMLFTSVAQNRGDVISTELLVSWTPDEQQEYMKSKLGSDLPIDENLINLILDALANGVYPYDVNIYKVRYWTQDLFGAMVQATGAMTVPQNNHGKTMIIFGRGHVYDEADVFSNLRGGGGSDLFATAYSMVDFITLVPDYIGCGDGEGREKAFNHNEGANAMVDIYRAGLKVTNSMGIKRNGQVFVGGYSQGGGNAMATLKYLRETGLLWSELPVHNAIFGGGPYDFGNTTLNYSVTVEETIDPEYYFMFVRGAKDAGYDVYDNPYDKINPEYWDEWDYYIENDIIRKENIPTRWREMFRPEAIEELSDPNGPLFQYARTLDVFDWDNHISILLTYGSGDKEVPYQNSIIARDAIRNNVPWYNFWRRWIINTRDFGEDVDHRGAGAFTLLNSIIEFGLHRNAHNAVNVNNYINGAKNQELTPEPLLTTNLSAITPRVELNARTTEKAKRNISDVKITAISTKNNYQKTSIQGNMIDMSSYKSGMYLIEAKVDGVRKTELYYRPKLDVVAPGNNYYYPLQKRQGIWILDINNLKNAITVNVFDKKLQLVNSFSVKEKKQVVLAGIKTGTYTVEVLTNERAYYLELKNTSGVKNDNSILYLQRSNEILLSLQNTKTALLEVYDIRGRVVQSVSDFTNQPYKISLKPGLKTGIYIVKAFLTNGTNLTHKIVIRQ